MKKKATKKRDTKNITKIFIISSIAIAAIFSAIYFSDISKSKEVVARVNGDNIYKSEVTAKLAEIFQGSSQSNLIQAPEISEMPSEIIKIVVREIYVDKKLLIKAKKVGIHKQSDIKNKIEQVKKAIINQGYMDYIVANEVNDQLISETYVNLSNQINGKKEYNFYHIILDNEKKAEEVYRAISKSPKKFAQQAKNNSIDKKSAENGGNIGFIIENSLSPEIAEILVKLDKNELSQPIKTSYGWHIIKYSDVRDAKPLPFDSVRNNIKNQLIQDKISNVKKDLFNDSEIEILVKLKDAKNSAESNKSDTKILEKEKAVEDEKKEQL